MGTNEQRWAVVTGASAGIGAAFARELAARGYGIVLVARREERLHTLAAEIAQNHRQPTRVVALDLAQLDAPLRLFEFTEREGIAVDVLVNNAGYGVTGHLQQQPWEKHRDFLQVLITSLTELCYRYVPGMQQRRRGFIINVASLAGIMPGSAGHTMYAASKAFVIKFSQSLALENETKGVHVTAVCPGFTYSEFHDVTQSRDVVSKMPSLLWMSSEDVAREGVEAALRGDVVYVNGRVNKLLAFVGKHLPNRWGLAFMRRQSKRYRKQIEE
jgi:uncharacterized protein